MKSILEEMETNRGVLLVVSLSHIWFLLKKNVMFSAMLDTTKKLQGLLRTSKVNAVSVIPPLTVVVKHAHHVMQTTLTANSINLVT
jgi:hypothetical protein